MDLKNKLPHSYRRELDGALMIETSQGFISLQAAYTYKLIDFQIAKHFPLSLDSQTSRDFFKD